MNKMYWVSDELKRLIAEHVRDGKGEDVLECLKEQTFLLRGSSHHYKTFGKDGPPPGYQAAPKRALSERLLDAEDKRLADRLSLGSEAALPSGSGST